MLWNIPQGIEMVFMCTVPAMKGRSCEHFGGYKTINRIPIPFTAFKDKHLTICDISEVNILVDESR